MKRKITVEYIKKEISDIRELDPESAHSSEDDLHQDVLKAIANGATNPAELAREALKSLKLDFPRWYA